MFLEPFISDGKIIKGEVGHKSRLSSSLSLTGQVVFSVLILSLDFTVLWQIFWQILLPQTMMFLLMQLPETKTKEDRQESEAVPLLTPGAPALGRAAAPSASASGWIAPF